VWAALILVAIVVVVFWVRGDDEGDAATGTNGTPGSSRSQEKLGDPVAGGTACDLVPKDDVAGAYDVKADELREAFVYRSSATEGVSCVIIRGDAALTEVHLYLGDQAKQMWTGDYADLHTGSLPPRSTRVPSELGEGIVQDKRIVIVHRPCRSSELLLVLNDPTRQLSSDQLLTLARGSLPASQDLGGCPA
jgi:hypothetical protein